MVLSFRRTEKESILMGADAYAYECFYMLSKARLAAPPTSLLSAATCFFFAMLLYAH